ncbi:peptidylprolyl isomerase [Crateriforma conspicua]|uniref:peptidylprolyl isomerase n=1 Tax=Crateriforma conspicua TaxID=2527996 RepID=UPI00118AB039|nr:peptidylprolyl isomerase [Crateriforma conspicua]QDV61659.1 Peptidyl-prolyl cis-trans isomerase B [Crateriforma conspicua]
MPRRTLRMFLITPSRIAGWTALLALAVSVVSWDAATLSAQDETTESAPTQDVSSESSEFGSLEIESQLPPDATEEEQLAELERLLETPEVQEAIAAFDQSHQELVEAMGDLNETYLRYRNEIDQTESGKAAFRERRERVRKLIHQTHRLANPILPFYREAATYALTMVQSNEERSIYNGATYESAARFLDAKRNEKYIFQAAMRSAVCTGQFDVARKIFDVLQGQELPQIDTNIRINLDQIEEDFNLEAERQRRDADKVFPKVKLHTTNGDVIAELYIDDAPSAVSHFIQLVEDGYYEDAEFMQVIDNLLALCSHAAESPPQKFLVDEHQKPDARRPLRGSLVMAGIPAEAGRFVPNSANRRFAIMMMPIPMVADSQTVFGRVIEGMEVVSTFQRVDPSKPKEKGELVLPPDRILEATIIDRPETLPEPEYIENPSR